MGVLKTTYPTLFLLVLAFALGLPTPMKGQQRVKFDYSRYETESLDEYRNVVDFVYPDLDLFGFSSTEDSLLPGVSLIDVSQFFDDTTTYFVDAEDQINALLARHKYLNGQIRSTDGFRIQIVSSSNRKTATGIQYRFESQYPEHTAYIKYESPYYKVRVGDFMKKRDADLFREKIIYDFPGAFLVEARVRVPKYSNTRQR